MGQLTLFKKSFVYILLCLCAYGATAQTQQLDISSYPLNSGVGSIQEAIDLNAFTVSHANNLVNLGLSKQPVWVKVKLSDTSSLNQKLIQIANPNLDRITMYYLRGSILDSATIGELEEIDNRRFNDQNFVFKLKDSIANQTIYFKIESGEQLFAPFEIASENTIREKNTNRDSIIFMYMGVMLVMFFYNIFLYVNTKDRNYFYYVMYILFVTLTQLTFHGFINKYLPASFNYIKIHSVYVFGALSGMATLLFMQNFIDTKRYLGKLNYIITFFVVIDFAAIVLSLLNQFQLSYTFVNINAGLGSMVVLLVAIYIAYKRNRSARFFLLSWSLFLASVIVFVLKDYGIIEYNLFSKYALLYGSALEVTLLSVALADRINILKKEKDRAQARALEVANENARIVQQQNTVLEQKVIERTKALTETNNSLTVALNTLKQAQTQLVESEKMASLGQLTAGIAHEINNPINFVTSNVKPLQRDIDELYQLQSKTEAIMEAKGLALDEINKLKRDIDFDYLKTEINYLLKGIHEGSSRTAEIVKGLRIFSRVDEDDIKLASINEGLDSTLIIINNQLNNKIAIDKDYANLPLIDCYPGKLNQVFLNLITNGIYAVKQKFKDQEGGKLIIKTELAGDNVNIVISDNGIGMNDATKTKLFEPFFTTKPVGDGTGLGLSIAYNTIKKHNGTINATSEEGVGTTFIITIPQRQVNG